MSEPQWCGGDVGPLSHSQDIPQHPGDGIQIFRSFYHFTYLRMIYLNTPEFNVYLQDIHRYLLPRCRGTTDRSRVCMLNVR